MYIPSTDAIDALVIVVKEASSGAKDDHQVEQYGQEGDGRLDDPIESDEDC